MSQFSRFQSSPSMVAFGSAAEATESARIAFLRRTYTHLSFAIFSLMGLIYVLFTVVPEPTMTALVQRMMSGYGWLVVMVAFMGVSYLANSWAAGDYSRGLQYAGLSLYVVAQAVILLPLLYVAIVVLDDPQIPILAGIITSVAFGGLTAFVMATKVDLSSWGTYLFVAGMVAIGLSLASVFFGFSLGLLFTGAMVALACGYILYDTSNVLHHYRTDQHVAASLALFSSMVLLFWYVLRFLIAMRSDE